jgi:predicted transcriptional regulator
VKRRIDATSYPNRNMISLTRRGKELSRKLEEITGLLSPE